MKKILRSYLLWLNFLLIISCQKTEETPTATMTLLNNDPNPSDTYWAVVSDQTGKVLSWKSLPNNVSTTLSYSSTDSVNVTLIASYGNGYQLTTYANVAPGTYSSPPPFQGPTILGTYKVQNLSPADYSQFQVTSECGQTQSQDQSEWQVNVCANSSLYVMAQKISAVPRYLYSPQISASGSVVIDQTTYNSLPEMKTKNVALGDSYNFGFLSVNVVKDWALSWIVLSYTFSDPGNVNAMNLYYPDKITSAFDEYFILLALNKPNNINFTFNTTVKDVSNYSIPTFTPTLDVVTSATTSNLNFDLSGSADYVKTIFTSYSNSSFFAWAINNPFSKKVSMVLPIFPDDLKKEIDFSFLATLKLQSIAIGDTDLGGYTSFYKNYILGQNKRVKNLKSKTYTPKTDGSIGGGG